MSLSPREQFDRFLLTSANLLIETNTHHDRHLTVPPQDERLAAHLATLRDIERKVGASVTASIVGLQELQITPGHHNGEAIRRGLHHRFGIWQPHSRHEVGEHIGATSSRQPDESEIIKVDRNRYALALRYGEFHVGIVHPMYSDATRRARQYDAISEYMADKPYAALIGDMNEEPLPFSSRRRLGRIGLKSAFVRGGGVHPVTLPTPEYKRYRSLPRRIGYELVGGGLCYDDIYVTEAMGIGKTGTEVSASDHRFVYASVTTPPGVSM